MAVFRDIKKRDHDKLLILDKAGERAKKNLKVEKKKKKKKDEYLFVQQFEETGQKRTVGTYFSFLILAILVVLVMNLMQIGNRLFTIAGDVEANAFDGYENLVEGGKDAIDLDFARAVQYFDSASYSFEKAKNSIWFLGNENQVPAKETLGDNTYSLLEAGEYLSNAASFFTQGFSGMNEIPILFMEFNALKNDIPDIPLNSISEKLKNSLEQFNSAAEELDLAKKKINSVPDLIIPQEIKDQVDALTDLIDEFQKRVPALLAMLGDRYPHRYLILFQNNTELRPTGGFIGSFLIIDINDGYITKADFHDVYDFDGQLNEHIPAPEEMSELTTNWRMRDSNFSPDFAVSAQKAMWFLEKEGGPGVDTVIAINQSLLGELLSVIGPIDVEGLGAQLTSQNYNIILTYIVESKLEGETTPKQVLDRVIPALQEKLGDEAQFKNVFAVIQKEIKSKNILGWSKNENVQHFFDEVGISGRITQTPEDEDYFNIIQINIGGNKSDAYIDTYVQHSTTIGSSGNLIDTVIINRTHTWEESVIEKWRKQINEFGYTELPGYIQDILGSGANKSVIKIFVPKGSELISVVGIDFDEVKSGYDEDLDKEFFYYTDIVEPGEDTSVILGYELPFDLDLGIVDEYRLTVQKQPGVLNYVRFIKKMIPHYPQVRYLRKYPEEDVFKTDELIKYETTLIGDQHFASLWGKN